MTRYLIWGGIGGTCIPVRDILLVPAETERYHQLCFNIKKKKKKLLIAWWGSGLGERSWGDTFCYNTQCGVRDVRNWVSLNQSMPHGLSD